MRDDAARRLSVGMLEDVAFPGDTVDVGRKNTLASQKTHAVGAGGVEGDQYEVGFGGASGEREGEDNQTGRCKDFPYHDTKCKGGVAIDQNLARAVLTAEPLRV